MLFDARTMYDQENPKADEVLRGIVESLPEAVGSCVDAAAAELDPVRQSALLKVNFSIPQTLRIARGGAGKSCSLLTLTKPLWFV